MTFALITEGASEFNILKKIVSVLYKNEDPICNPIQPKLEDSGKQDGAGGWNEVLKYCEREEELKSIFVENDYLIIQIDTDQSQQQPFNVAQPNGIKDDALVNAVRDRLCSSLPESVRTNYLNRIIFAVCVQTVECWLLPIYFVDEKANLRKSTLTCLDKLNRELKRLNKKTIPAASKNSAHSIIAYKEAMSDWRKANDVIKSARSQHSLKLFIEEISNKVSLG
jgi:hypothetical protein